MINITFPDGNTRAYEKSITGFQIADGISKSLSKKALAIAVNDQLQDLSIPLSEDAHVRIITTDDAEGLEIIRHDAAHVLAQAVKKLFPDAQITIGPVIQDGFYYDVLPKENLTHDDLLKLEQQMHKIGDQNITISREVWSRDDAIKMFKSIGETYKAEIIESIPSQESITLYRQGDFVDLCRGPHAPSTRFVKHFKLMKLAGAYWRGDSNNVMLQRIYGTAWATKEDLDAHLHRIEEAERRDHRKLGVQLDLFHMQDEAPGMVFWHHNGWVIFRELENYIRSKIFANGYIEVRTPQLVDLSLWKKSGHWEKFGENMFVVENDDKVMALKPMNCPCHIEIFKTKLTSYRDLPIRMSEFGSCMRNESSGSLHGLMRVRGMTQDDAHIFCTEEQIKSETIAFCSLLQEVYREIGFNEIKVKFSDRPKVRAGTDETWDKAESALREATLASGLTFELNQGDGAFYGPKLEFHLRDAIGREWQCGTFQVDFVLPERLGAHYIDTNGDKQAPVILHRAIFGSLERFIGMLIEHYAGNFPLWLAPTQVVVLTIVDDANEYAARVHEQLVSSGFRSLLDKGKEKINYKVRKYSLLKIPYTIVIGRKEVEDGSIMVREFGSDVQKSYSQLREFEQWLETKIRSKQ